MTRAKVRAMTRAKNTAFTRCSEPALLCVLLACAIAGRAQVAPAAVASPLYTGFQIPTVNGSVRFSVSASDRVTLGYDGDNQSDNSLTVSGNAAFLSSSDVHPTSVVYSGGYLGDTSGQPSTVFQELELTQVYNTRQWKYTVSDSVRYLPNTPSTGLSGITGVGDLGVSNGYETQQSALTPYATRVENSATAAARRNITGSTSLELQGTYDLERFLNAPGAIQSDDYGGSGDLNHRIDALSSTGARYQYNVFAYTGVNGSLISQGVSFFYTRALNRQFAFTLSAGPQYIGASTLSGSPARLTYSIDSHLTYTGSVRSGVNVTASFVRATTSGYGVTFGAETDTASLSATRRLMRSLGVSAQVNYGQNSGLQQAGNTELTTHSLVASGQANRALGRTLSAYASYSWQRQSTQGQALGITPLNGVTQVLGVGLTYSPPPRHFARN